MSCSKDFGAQRENKVSHMGRKGVLLFTGAEALGGALMSLFFVTIGAAAGSVSALLQTGWLTAFIALQLTIHLGITVGLGRLLGLPIQVSLSISPLALNNSRGTVLLSNVHL